MTKWFETLIVLLRGLINEAPYKIFIFISPVLLIITLAWGKYFKLFFVFFLYSIVGIIFRHAVKDLRGRIKEVNPNNFNKKNLWLTSIYQIVNMGLVVALVMIIFKIYN